MWNKRDKDGNDADLDTYLVEHLSGEEPLNLFPTFEEFKEVVKWLQIGKQQALMEYLTSSLRS